MDATTTINTFHGGRPHCPSCYFEPIGNEGEICRKCGDTIFHPCPNCRENVYRSDKFCTTCGEAITPRQHPSMRNMEAVVVFGALALAAFYIIKELKEPRI